jgi:predicted deacylase
MVLSGYMEIHHIDCGSSKLSLQIFDSGMSSHIGPTVVVSAGMDGDEYVGIEAAGRLVATFSHTKPLKGRLVIIPLVNTPGFEAKMSKNPHDGKYPKRVYPGNPKGTETERLMAWMTSHYIYDADIWIDLHGGATNESLTPFAGGCQTRDNRVNDMTRRILRATGAPICIYQKNYRWRKVEALAKHGCSYGMFECGDRGNAREAEIKQAEDWVNRVLADFGLMRQIKQVKTSSTWFEEMHEYINTKDLQTWNPSVTSGQVIPKGQILGTVNGISLVASQNGTVLWHILPGFVSKNDTLAAIAR